MVAFAILWMENVLVALDGQEIIVKKNVPLGIMAQAAILIARVRTMEFATGFLEAVSASKVTMEEFVNTHAFLDFMVWIVLTSVTAKMELVVMQRVDSAFAQQVSMAASVKKSAHLECLETTAINSVTVKMKAPATQ